MVTEVKDCLCCILGFPVNQVSAVLSCPPPTHTATPTHPPSRTKVQRSSSSNLLADYLKHVKRRSSAHGLSRWSTLVILLHTRIYASTMQLTLSGASSMSSITLSDVSVNSGGQMANTFPLEPVLQAFHIATTISRTLLTLLMASLAFSEIFLAYPFFGCLY